jgi:hypothetical protein
MGNATAVIGIRKIDDAHDCSALASRLYWSRHNSLQHGSERFQVDHFVVGDFAARFVSTIDRMSGDTCQRP